MVVIWPRLRARYPSMPSVMEAAINMAEASNSLAPCSLLKWLEDKIQISRGMLQMRTSVMELGRFHRAAREASGRVPELNSIILHGGAERNREKVLLRQNAPGMVLQTIRRNSIWRAYFGVAGAIALGFGCFAMI